MSQSEEAVAEDNREGDKQDDDAEDDIGAGEREHPESLGVTAEAARGHRLVDLFGQGVRLAQQSPGGRGDELASRLVVLDRADRPCAPGLVHVRHRAEEQEDVAVGHPHDQDEHPGHAERAERCKELDPRGGQGEQNYQRDGQRHAADDETCGRKPLGGDSDLGALPGPQRDHDLAGGDDRQRGGQHDDPGEDRHEEPDPLDEEPHGHVRDRRDHQGECVRRQQHLDVADHRCGDQQGKQAEQFHPRVDALEQPGSLGDVLAEHDLTQQPGAAVEGLLDETALLALPDAPAGAHRHLPLQQPRRGPGGRLRRRRWVGDGGSRLEGGHAVVRDSASRRSAVAAASGTASPPLRATLLITQTRTNTDRPTTAMPTTAETR